MKNKLLMVFALFLGFSFFKVNGAAVELATGLYAIVSKGDYDKYHWMRDLFKKDPSLFAIAIDFTFAGKRLDYYVGRDLDKSKINTPATYGYQMEILKKRSHVEQIRDLLNAVRIRFNGGIASKESTYKEKMKSKDGQKIWSFVDKVVTEYEEKEKESEV